MHFGSLFIFQGPYFHYFGFIHAKNVNSVCMYTDLQASVLVYTVGKFCFDLRLCINFHTSSFWVLILAAGGPYWVLISQKDGFLSQSLGLGVLISFGSCE